MRVVMVSKALVVGAYQRKAEELARLPGVELTVVVPPAWKDRRGTVALEQRSSHGYRLLVAPLWLNGQYHLHFYPTLGQILREIRPDVLHMDEEPYNLATYQALRASHTVGACSLFFTWQNLFRRYPWPFRHIEQANFRRASHAIAGNQDAASVLRAKGYCGPISVIPQFGVDPELFTPEPLSHSGFVIGYAGGLIPEKGIDILLRACAGLPPVDWRLRIAGEGPERGRLARQAGELPAGHVEFLDRYPSARMAEFYNGLDVLVLPSISRPNWTEQFGRVLVEAMACGIPTIGSSCGEIPRVIGDAGLIFPEGNSDALARALTELAMEPDRRLALARLGRARVLARFTQEQVARATYQVYSEMLGASAG